MTRPTELDVDLLTRFIQERPDDAAAMMAQAMNDPELSPAARDIARLQHAYITDPDFKAELADKVWSLAETQEPT